jgi:hypothetical protein
MSTLKTANRYLSAVIALGVIAVVVFLMAGIAAPAFSTAIHPVRSAQTAAATPVPGDVIPLKSLTDLTSLNATVTITVDGLIDGKRTQGDLTALVSTNKDGKSQVTVSGSLLGQIAAKVGGSAVGLFTPSKVDVYKVPTGTYIAVGGFIPICIKPEALNSTEALDELSPQALLTMLTNSDVARGQLVGDETRNGVAVKHYVINGETFVTSAQNSSDPKLKAFGDALWSAKDADVYVDPVTGYPVAFSGSYSGTFEPLKFEGDFSVQIELTGTDTNPRVDLPSSCNKPIVK